MIRHEPDRYLASVPSKQPVPSFTPPAWTEAAPCLAEQDVFFDAAEAETNTKKAAIDKAKEVCASCPFKDACLAMAMSGESGVRHESRWGIWGGLTPKERAERGGAA